MRACARMRQAQISSWSRKTLGLDKIEGSEALPPIHARPCVRRAIRYGDGWILIAGSASDGDPLDYVPRFRQMAEEAGCDPGSLSVTAAGARITPVDRRAIRVREWRRLTVTRCSVQ